jgi:acetoin utilization deacetylase AcuC-like enzyme
VERIGIHWDPRQLGPVPDSYAFYASIPRLTVEAFQSSGLPVEVVGGWNPASLEELALAHDPEHVLKVLEGRDTNGFGNENPTVAEAACWEVGSFLSAAFEAARSGRNSISPSRGFHHATWGECWNFCTFNGLIVTALRLRDEGLVRKVGILDFDCHWGNGTDDILERLKPDWIVHWSFGKFKRIVRLGIGWDAWLAGLAGELESRFAGCDILLYQAGADPHIDDRFGGELGTEQMRLRDRTVFRWAESHKIPVAWNLAGGYQEPVSRIVDIHRITLQECLGATGLH